MASDKRKQSVYLPAEMLADARAEAKRMDRTLSWVMQRAWSIAREQIMKHPSGPGL